MGFNCGIVGLPNVGKSTLFNALTKTVAAQAANYPFCTIEPNSGRVGVPDARLDRISAIAQSKTTIPTYLDVVDIAGLVKGASKGEGLGNQFLGNIRSVDAIIHVLRCFDNDDITHVSGSVDPVRDAEIIEMELLFSDTESLEKRQQNLAKRAKGGDKEAKETLTLIEKILPFMHDGTLARDIPLDKDAKALLPRLQLLTSKPLLYVCNVSEDDASTGNDYTKEVFSMAEKKGCEAVVISADIESQIAALEGAEQKEFLESLGLLQSGLNTVIEKGYALLDLLTFFTVGPKEARAWTCIKGSKAPQAAGVIHTDFERGFICAETVAYDDYIACNGEAGAKEAGKLRLEGRDYSAQDGDIFHFRFNV
jgi:hypothetical protein